MFVVFIAGGSCSGKTTFTKEILNILCSCTSSCISIKMDDYYKEIPEGIDFYQYKTNTNFDNPEQLDLKRLHRHIVDLKAGKSIDKPIFNFKIERRIATEKITSPDILLLDGTASLYFAERFMPKSQHTFKIYIEVDPDVLLKRRIERDLSERGYVDELSVTTKDREFVRPTFHKVIEPTKYFADIIITNDDIDYLQAIAQLKNKLHMAHHVEIGDIS